MKKFALPLWTAALLGSFFSGRPDTVAYWRFEAGPANAVVRHSGAAGAFDGVTPDASGNGNDLSASTQGGSAGYAYRRDVPWASVPRSGAANRFSVKNTGPSPAFFTSRAGPPPPGIDARTFQPARFTVEVSYKPEANAGYRTVVCRDARHVATSNGDLAAFYLQVRPDDSVGVLFTDVAGFTHEAFSPPGLIYGFGFASNPEGMGVPWYDLAAVSDGVNLRVYVNRVLVASTDMRTSGSPHTALAIGTGKGTDWTAGAWAVGRGLYAGGHTDRAYGFIDEIRISDDALDAGAMLAVRPPQARQVKWTGQTVTFDLVSGLAGGACHVMKASELNLSPGNWSPLFTKTFDSEGRLAFSATVYPELPGRFFLLVPEILPAPPGPLAYELAGGSANWPAHIRARIIYAVEGAVGQYNRYGRFAKHLVVNYNPGVPTARGNYDGHIDFGGQIGYRTALHEIGHALGVGTVWNWSNLIRNGVWTGANAVRQIRAFDGPSANVYSDGTHFWPYGLNYESEGSTENNRRHVLMVAAFRKDLRIQ